MKYFPTTPPREVARLLLSSTVGLVLGCGPGAGITCAEAAGPVPGIEGQPLAANALRVAEALEFLGAPLAAESSRTLAEAARGRDADAVQRTLDSHALFVIDINPELRVKVSRGPAAATLHQGGFTPLLVKVVNGAAVSQRLRVSSPQAGPVYAGAAEVILKRQQQTELNVNANTGDATDRFLEVEMFSAPPMTEHLSGLGVEYAIALLYSHEPGKREARIGFDIGQGTQDIGFRGEVPVLFDVKPAVPVKLRVLDDDGEPTVARMTFRDHQGRVHPPQAKRVAPDFFFQPQIYRRDGDVVALPPGEFTVEFCRGPEYRVLKKTLTVPGGGEAALELRLERWIDPMGAGFYSGDHHIHGAGCSHYTAPTEGVSPQDMFLQVKGEGLNVGCVLTWGPCFDFQRRYFSRGADGVSEPLTLIKYDLEISGFGSAALGHVCLLNLRDQTYPGSEGTKTKGWPTWTAPVMRWAKEQGGVTGYPHSDLSVDAAAFTKRYFARNDRDRSGSLQPGEGDDEILPAGFGEIDADGDGLVTPEELEKRADRAADELPYYVLPSMRGSGAMEVFITAAEGVCDFISAMDTARVGEWNTWYHLMNCGLPVKLSGETDFPCMSSRRVGQGRVYVRMADQAVPSLDFPGWCRGLAAGRSYVSDGFAHALEFSVGGAGPGTGEVGLDSPGQVNVTADVAFAPETPKAVAYGTLDVAEGRRVAGDTVNLHAPRSDVVVRGGERLVEIIVNGVAAASQVVPADGEVHSLSFGVPIARSSWVALRQFPQLHTNPVVVTVGGKPVRASKRSAQWCAESVDLLWENRSRHIAGPERPAARAAYDRAIALYRMREAEAEVE